MELFTTLDDVVIYNKEKHQCLWSNRIDGKFILSHGDKFQEAWKPVCKGIIYGVVGKIQLLPGSDWKLLVITNRAFVGFLPGGVEVYSITKVAALSLSSDVVDFNDLELEPCSQHEQSFDAENAENKTGPQQRVQQTWNNIKSGANNITEKTNMFLKDLKDRDKMEKRLLEELLKMFNDSTSYYYSPNGDLSNTRQRLENIHEPYTWKQTDDRFFWNKYMLVDLIESENPTAVDWILPIIQGFVQIERCSIDHLEYLNPKNGDVYDGASDDEEDAWDFVDHIGLKEKYRTGEDLKEDEFDLIVISRRSRHQAGTRYNRRGVNDNGHVANYVETEQIVCILTHILSHVQVRGSVPVYWSQPGYKYRPMPLINRDKDETKAAFKKHFDEELQEYDQQVIVSLVEQVGREKIIADAFLENIFEYNSDKLVYVTFDFHEHCRGMKFQNVAILTSAIESYINRLGFHWFDCSGLIMKQRGVFRVNCMDCLDRTNVIQAAIARDVLSIILRKLGRLIPEESISPLCRRIHNYLWANNGDAISRQYAGTAAMKGDFTRTGERKMLGVVKDGYNSANRYYLNRFKDNYRQTVIDMMLGKPIAEDLSAIVATPATTEEDLWTSDKEECIAQLIRHSELALLPPDEECLGGWALVDPFTFVLPTENPQDEDVILMLTHQAYYIARYNDELEELFSYQRIPLENLEKIEIGLETVHFRNQFTFMRLLYRHNKSSGYFHTMRTIPKRSLDESKAILLSIAEVFLCVCRQQCMELRVVQGKFDKKRSKPQPNIKPLTSKRTLSTSSRSNDIKISDDVAEKEGPMDTCPENSSTLKSSAGKSELPEIRVSGSESNEFMEFHRKFSPDYKKDSSSPEIICRPNDKGDSSVKPESPKNSRSAQQPEPIKDPLKQTVNKMDFFLRKTKQAIGNVAPRLRDLSPSANRQEVSRKSNSDNRDVVPQKSTLQRLNERLTSRSGTDVRNPLKILPEFRNKIQIVLSSPRSKRKQKIHTDEEIKRRETCRTEIVEL